MEGSAAAKTPNAPLVSPAGVAIPVKRRFTLSVVNARRWENFKSNRRGYWSLWIFLFLFIVTMFAEFIANDKPFFVRFDGKSFFPAVISYPETAFGGDF